MTRWTADTMPYAVLLFLLGATFGCMLGEAIGNVRDVIRDWRHRREVRVRVGTPPKGA
jgi:hypothetical protein